MNNLTVAGTFSKDPSLWGIPELMAVQSLPDGMIELSNGNTYIDWVSGLGAILLGNGHVGFNDRIKDVVKFGNGFSVVSKLEYMVADKLAYRVKHLLGGEVGVRFMKTGTDTTTVAVRLARAVTGKNVVIRYGYSGWNDWSQSSSPSRGVVPCVRDYIYDVEFGELEIIEEHMKLGDTACVIIEHPAQDAPEGYYDGVRQLCDKYGALFVMDEVVTGLRYGVDGACGRYGIEPDLICYGKSLGNGYPISAVVGKKEYMDEFKGDSPVFCSSTSWGDTVSLWAADYVLNHVGKEEVDKVWATGESLISGLRDAGLPIFGHGGRFIIEYRSNLDRAVFIRAMYNNGVLANRPFLPTLLHTDAMVAHTIKTSYLAVDAMNLPKEDKLEFIGGEGNLPLELFKRR